MSAVLSETAAENERLRTRLEATERKLRHAQAVISADRWAVIAQGACEPGSPGGARLVASQLTCPVPNGEPRACVVCNDRLAPGVVVRVVVDGYSTRFVGFACPTHPEEV